jgi:hypothetical protein
MKDCLHSIRELKALGVEIFFEKERLDTGDITSEILLSFYGTLAQEESVSISGNMRWSYHQRMRNGDFLTTCAPYGYRLINGNLVVEESEAETVRYIFDCFLGGMGSRAIVAALVRRNTPNRYGCMTWDRGAIMEMLRNEKYIGDTLLQKGYQTDTFPYMRKMNKGERLQYYIENSHPAIISKEVFDRVASLRACKREWFCPDNAGSCYAFSRRIECGICGNTFRRRVCNGKTYWVCRKHNADKDNCPVKQIPEPTLEAAFVRLWNKLHAYRYDILYPMLDQLEELRTRQVKQNQRIVDIDLEVSSLIGQNHILSQLRSKGYMDEIMYTAKANEFNTSIASLRQERQRLLDDEDDDPIAATKMFIGMLESSPKPLPAFDADCFNGIVDKIIVLSHTEVRFRLRNGLEITEAVQRIGR